jgi:hypothetical protein
MGPQRIILIDLLILNDLLLDAKFEWIFPLELSLQLLVIEEAGSTLELLFFRRGLLLAVNVLGRLISELYGWQLAIILRCLVAVGACLLSFL